MRTTSNMKDYTNLNNNDDKVKDILMNKMISKNINYKIMYQKQKNRLDKKTHLRQSMEKLNGEAFKHLNILSSGGISNQQTDDSHITGSEQNRQGVIASQKKSFSSYRKSNQGSILPDLNASKQGFFPASPR